MNNIYQHYIIDLSSNNNFVQIPTVQGDGNNIRGFEVELIENGVQYEIDQNDCVIAIMGTKPDTSQIMNDCQLTDDGYIQVDITSQMSAVKGRGDYQIVLMSRSTNSQLKSFPFHIFTTPAAFDIDHIVSTDEFQTLTRNIVKTDEVIEEANDTISDMRDLESSVEKAEKVRVNAEKNRIDAESTRQSNESTRQSNENTRKTNENTRKANEISRQNAETDRYNAETDRDNAESSRMSNEAARQNNETIRQANENIRQTNTATAIANTNTATERANNAAIICEDIIGESGIVAQKATEAASSAASAATSAANALASEKNAETSETNAAKSELAAATSAANAANSEATANEKAAEALNYSEQAKSYAVGGTGTRAEEDIDNAKYYYEQARGISSGLAGTLMPMGTVNFANLPTLSSVDSGWMYNISDQFTTTSDFKEGSGHIIPAGANVYKTADEKWDVLAGTPVTGIKGSAESSYRKGNVDLTAENIGLGKVPNVSTNDQTPTFTQATARANIASGEKLSTIMGKIMKFFADLKTVAFSGKYSDLTGTPIIPTASITTPKANGTAAVGTEAAFARGDHAHPAQTTISGNAGSATKLATARTIDGVSFNGSAAITHYGTCSTAAATAAKVVAITGFSLVTGAGVKVKFTVTNTAASPTLNVNNTGAKPIYYRGAAIIAGYLAANRTYEFVYNGTQWDLVGDLDTNNKYSNMTAATDSAAGKAGLVPAPAAGAQDLFLAGDAKWRSASIPSADNTFRLGTSVHRWARIDTVLAYIYSDLKIAGHIMPQTTEQSSIGKSDGKFFKIFVKEAHVYPSLFLHENTASGAEIYHTISGGGDGLIRLIAHSRYVRFGMDNDANWLDIYRDQESGSMCIFSKDYAPLKIGRNSVHYFNLDYDAGTGITTLRSSSTSMMLEMIGGSLIVRDSRNGKPYLPVAASAFNVNSSVRYKENLQEMTEEQALDIMRYRVLTYDYKEECGGAKDQQGLLAEDVYEINPYPVTLDEEGRPDAIDYSKFVPQLIKMVQIQQEQINNLKNEIAMLENNKNS